jgi:hypothetical protein
LKSGRDSTTLAGKNSHVGRDSDVFAGGIADKLGNRYEAKWLVCQFLDVFGGKAQSIRYEGISKAFRGFEFALNRGDQVEWHQTKIKNPNGNWTLSALKREGVMAAFRQRLTVDENSRCIFVSEDPARDIRTLADKAAVANELGEYLEALGKEQVPKFEELCDAWVANKDLAFRWLRRIRFRTESESSIDSAILAFSELYFWCAKDIFAVLREFVETRINKEITTETARQELRRSGKILIKDWSLEPTLHERLSTETRAYLDTYNPFGAGGTTISRPEARKMFEWATDPGGPRVILLTGAAGSGKSGVIREFIDCLRNSGILHLAFRIDHYLESASPQALGKAITGRDESVVATLKGIAPDQLSVLIADQIDAVSEVSGRNGAVKRTVLKLVDDVRNFGSVRMIIACRSFDLDSDQRLKALKETHGIEHVDLLPLTWEGDVEPVLRAKGVDFASLSVSQRSLLCLPLNLAIFFEAYDGAAGGFTSRADLFSKLLERKAKTVRENRQPTWDLIAPLSKLASWMSDRQRLDAPGDILADFSGALDILASEALIVRSRGRVNLFHESFFDYIYARGFASHQQSIEKLLTSSEQHLFRRTQVRQILETLRQVETHRYLRELAVALTSDDVRYHIKVAVAQWLGSINDPTPQEKDIVSSLDSGHGPFPPLLRYAFLGSLGWFDRLLHDGWISAVLTGTNDARRDNVLAWLPNVAGQRPDEISELLDQWWGGAADRGEILLNWFAFVKRQKPDLRLVDLFCRVIRAHLPELFRKIRQTRDSLFFHVWIREDRPGAADILSAYFDAWFEAHPNQHPFNTGFHSLDAHSLGEMAKRMPEAFVEGSISAFLRSIEVIVLKEAQGEHDYAFTHRVFSGHHFGADAFLNIFREAIREVARRSPHRARCILQRMDPKKHEAFTHIWLETIRANGNSLCDLLNQVVESPHIFDAGWDGAGWKSFADATRETIAYLNNSDATRLESKILAYRPELNTAARLTQRLKNEEIDRWVNRGTILAILNRAGHEQWCILETIGEQRLSEQGRLQLTQLRRKFRNLRVQEPHHLEARYVQSPTSVIMQPV